MPKGKHKAGYRRPRTGEKRRVRQPFQFEALPEEALQFVEDARQWRCRCKELKKKPHRHGWAALPALLQKEFNVKISRSALHRGYDVIVEQERAEIIARNEGVRELAGQLERTGFQNLPAATLNALAGEALAALHAATPAEKQQSLSNLLFLQAQLMRAQAAKDRAALQKDKVDLDRQKFDAMREKLGGLKKKLGRKKPLTQAELKKEIDEIYDL